jgi:hypothetical protein
MRYALVLLLLVGCSDRKSAADPGCDTTADCPGGLVCADGSCVAPDPCNATADCCPGAVCKGGVCEVAPAECMADGDCGDPLRVCVDGLCQRRPCGGGCPNGARCIADYCYVGPPCGGQCGAEDACFPHRDECRKAPASCAESCGAGFVRVVTHSTDYNGAVCDLAEAECTCVQAPALQPADYGRYASMSLRGGAPVFAAYDADYGDLVFVEGVESDMPRVTYLDGVPPDGPLQADPGGPRGGRTAPGPDVGRYASLDADPAGGLHVAYYDADARTLRGVAADASGHWSSPVVIDQEAEADVGRYARLRTDANGGVHVAYFAARSVGSPGLLTGVRYAYSADGANFAVTLVSEGQAPESQAMLPVAGETPLGMGVMPCLDVGPDGQAYIGFYDSAEHDFWLARGGVDGFEVHPLDGAPSESWPPDPGGRYADVLHHDLGRSCALVVEAPDVVTVVFLDGDTHALLAYHGPVGGGGALDMVDPGGDGTHRLLGGDTAIALDGAGRPVVVYQDASGNDLVLSVRGDAGWSAQPLVVASAGAMGFYNSLAIPPGGQAIIGTLELATAGRGLVKPKLRVFRQDIPAF